MKKLNWLWIGIIGGLALALIGWRAFSGPYRFQGSLIDPPIKAAEIVLTDQNGQPFRLSDQQGNVVLVFFGYTHCPDVCPVTLSEFKQVRQALGRDANRVRFVFITVDPERDTPQVIGDYLNRFDPSFIGLTGSQAELEKVWKDYFVYQQKVEAGSASGYLMDHSSIVYAIDPSGNWRLTYAFGMEVEKMTEDVRHLVQ